MKLDSVVWIILAISAVVGLMGSLVNAIFNRNRLNPTNKEKIGLRNRFVYAILGLAFPVIMTILFVVHPTKPDFANSLIIALAYVLVVIGFIKSDADYSSLIVHLLFAFAILLYGALYFIGIYWLFVSIVLLLLSLGYCAWHIFDLADSFDSVFGFALSGNLMMPQRRVMKRAMLKTRMIRVASSKISCASVVLGCEAWLQEKVPNKKPYGIRRIYSKDSRYVVSCDQKLDSYNRALTAYMEKYGEEHSNIAHLYNNIGYAYSQLGDYNQALTYYNQAFSICKKVYGVKHSNTIKVRENINILSKRHPKIRTKLNYNTE